MRQSARHPKPFTSFFMAAAAAALFLTAPAWAASAGNDLPQSTVDQIVSIVAAKEARTPAQRKIDSRLLQDLLESRGQQLAPGVQLEPAQIKRITPDSLLVDIAVQSSAAVAGVVAQIEARGGRVVYASFEYATVRAVIQVSDTESLADSEEVTFIQPAVEALTSGGALAQRARLPFAMRALTVRNRLATALAAVRNLKPVPLTGSVTSQGDRAHRADDVRTTFGARGAGIRIGVLSDSYDVNGGAASDATNGDLPGTGNPLGHTTPVTVLQDYPTGADEGRAMLQIVHDLAPDAQLFFATAFVSEASFASNITALRNSPNNCDIIIDDIFYYDEPPFQDGPVARAVNTVTASGALYFSSAGNEGSVAKGTAGYYEGDFNSNGSPAFTFPGGGKAGTIHNFGTVATPVSGDIIQAVNGLNNANLYTLMWSDPQGGSANDYDLFLVSAGGTVKGQSTNVQTGTQNPYESISPLTLVSGDRLVVFKSSSASVRAFAINTFRGRLAVVTTGQTHGHSSAADAFSVGAASASAVYPSAFSGSSLIEGFSSDGPRRLFFNPDGTQITPGNVLFGTGGGTVRNKPDIAAADGVSTTLPAGNLNPFYGTSAAAPHAGAIAALLKSANPSLTPAQIRSILISTAVDVESAGYDNISGAGILQAYQAMQGAPSGGSCGVTGLQTKPVSSDNAPGHSASAGLAEPPAIADLPAGGTWTRAAKPNGEVWTYKFTVGEAATGGDWSSGASLARPLTALPTNSGSAATGPLANGFPLEGILMQPRFATDADPTAPGAIEAIRRYEVKFDAAAAPLSPELVNLSGGKSGWVSVQLDQVQLASVRAQSLPYRCIPQSAIPGLPALSSATSSVTGSLPIAARLASPLDVAAASETGRGLAIVSANFTSPDPALRISSARVRVAIKARHLDQQTVWLSAGSRTILLWNGWGGSDNGLFDDSGKLQDSIILDRVLTDDIADEVIRPWTLTIANADRGEAAQLQELWIALTTATPGGQSVVSPDATIDLVAQRSYLKTAPSNGGSEISQPTIGQTVYFYGDYSVNGSGSNVSISNRLLLDGSVYCFGTYSVSPGLSYWFGCNSGWAATSGSHTLQFDVDYTNAVVETNEGNNSAARSIVASGLDFVAQRSYLKTASSNGGSEISQPAIGQTVYFYGDYSVNGSGSSVSISNRLLLDGSVYCFGTYSVSPGLSYWFGCNSGWAATSGSHSLQFDVDYTNAIAETNEGNNSAFASITPAGLDFVAQRSYLKTASSNGGSEVSQPTVGQTVYFYGDYTVNGSGSSVSISNRLLLDGSAYCFGTYSVSPGLSYWFGCNSGWAATSGSHTLQFDVDYTNAVAETNEGNNSASTNITPTGLDVVAQRAYLKTASSNGGSEVSQPTVGQTVYFYGDYTINGTGSAVTISNRALLDGSVFCFGTFSASPGSSYWFGCNSGWTATSGTHTLQVDFDYTNTVAESNENNNSASTSITATGGLDIVAQRAYMRSAASGGGVEVNPPVAGQTVYFHGDYQVTGSGSAVNVTERAVLDGTAFCSCSSLSNPGSSYTSSCSQGWTATAGSHTLQWDFDYSNAVSETNEANNSASISFTPSANQSLSVTRSGSGSGTVTSNPAGISCGGTCSATYPYNTPVTLFASAVSGSVFTGWTGEGCSGTGTCQVTMSQTRNVTAIFSATSIRAIVRTDIDRDRRTDVSIFRPLAGNWFFRASSTGQTTYVLNWGPQASDIPVPGDYDGDGAVDAAIFRPLAGDWYIRRSSDGATMYIPNYGPQQNDKPVPADYDGDGKTDIAIFRPIAGDWYIRQSSNGQTLYVANFGPASGDVPVPGDYDGDGKADIAIFRPIAGDWYIRRSSNGTLMYVPNYGPQQNDKPVPADYDGDGKTDIAIFRPLAGDWYIRQSSNTQTLRVPNFGPVSGDIPVPGDYDGDGMADIAIFRPIAGDWYVLQSTTGTMILVPNYGPQQNDKPLPAYQW